MRGTTRSVVIVCTFSVAATISACKGDNRRAPSADSRANVSGVSLRLNFKPGEVYEYRSECQRTIMEQALGQEMKTDNEVVIALRFDVLEREAGGVKMNATYQKVAVRLRNRLLSTAYDSDDSSGNSGGALGSLRGLIGKNFSLLIEPDGEVREITGLDTLQRNLERDNSAEPMAGATASFVQKVVSDKAMRGMMNESFHIYPAAAVRIGDTWVNERRASSSIGELVLQNTYRLTDIKNGIASINVTARIASDSSQKSDLAGELKGVKIDLKGALNGTLAVEVATGMLREYKTRQQLTGNITISGMTVPITTTTDTRMTGKRLR